MKYKLSRALESATSELHSRLLKFSKKGYSFQYDEPKDQYLFNSPYEGVLYEMTIDGIKITRLDDVANTNESAYFYKLFNRNRKNAYKLVALLDSSKIIDSYIKSKNISTENNYGIDHKLTYKDREIINKYNDKIMNQFRLIDKDLFKGILTPKQASDDKYSILNKYKKLDKESSKRNSITKESIVTESTDWVTDDLLNQVEMLSYVNEVDAEFINNNSELVITNPHTSEKVTLSLDDYPDSESFLADILEYLSDFTGKDLTGILDD